ncbi:MAG: oxygen-independent coproporphyrinogen III oxidase [Chitinophagaceae bacterium]
MNHNILNPLLVNKYNQPVPRYTSYPTVPFWNQKINPAEWMEQFAEQFSNQNAVNGISIYIHLPFCESLCTYCGCNKKITGNHNVEAAYLQAIEKEWRIYRRQMNETPVIREIHLGGGTPTFFSAKHLKQLIDSITRNSIVHPHFEFSIEGHPNNTTIQHLETLHASGFRRISYGVQDLDEKVQRLINRIQPFEKVKEATDNARAAGFTSVNFDLIYGLPGQTIASIEHTIEQVLTLKPDRIAFYSYAHVPWTSKGQRLFNENDLPTGSDKIQLYLTGKKLLMAHGYADIGMDHFALATDDLYKAWQKERLHRNFMGYGTQQTGLLLGLGVSAISDLGNAYAQNNKTLHDYYASVHANELAVQRGFFLSSEDIVFKKYILDIACKGHTVFRKADISLLHAYSFPVLDGLSADDLVNFNEEGLQLTDTGHYFIRNVCSAFDLYLQRNKAGAMQQVFSKAI